MTDLAHLRDLLAKATPGPWRILDPAHHANAVAGPGLSWPADASFAARNQANTALIVALVNAAPALLAAAEAVERAEESHRRAVGDRRMAEDDRDDFKAIADQHYADYLVVVAERDEARATVERVRALITGWATKAKDGRRSWVERVWYSRMSNHLRAALDQPKEDA